jgi:WXG100 family type VII secretion target
MPDNGAFQGGNSGLSGADTDAIRRSAGEFEGAVNACLKVEQGVNDILAQMGMTWKGEAATGFAAVMERWGKEFRKVIDGLDAIKDSLHGTHHEFSRNEYDQLNVASQIAATLGG